MVDLKAEQEAKQGRSLTMVSIETSDDKLRIIAKREQ